MLLDTWTCWLSLIDMSADDTPLGYKTYWRVSERLDVQYALTLNFAKGPLEAEWGGAELAGVTASYLPRDHASVLHHGAFWSILSFLLSHYSSPLLVSLCARRYT